MDGYLRSSRQISTVPHFDSNSFDLIIHHSLKTSEPSLVITRTNTPGIHERCRSPSISNRRPSAWVNIVSRFGQRSSCGPVLLIISRGLFIRSGSSHFSVPSSLLRPSTVFVERRILLSAFREVNPPASTLPTSFKLHPLHVVPRCCKNMEVYWPLHAWK